MAAGRGGGAEVYCRRPGPAIHPVKRPPCHPATLPCRPSLAQPQPQPFGRQSGEVLQLTWPPTVNEGHLSPDLLAVKSTLGAQAPRSTGQGDSRRVWRDSWLPGPHSSPSARLRPNGPSAFDPPRAMWCACNKSGFMRRERVEREVDLLCSVKGDTHFLSESDENPPICCTHSSNRHRTLSRQALLVGTTGHSERGVRRWRTFISINLSRPNNIGRVDKGVTSQILNKHLQGKTSGRQKMIKIQLFDKIFGVVGITKDISFCTRRFTSAANFELKTPRCICRTDGVTAPVYGLKPSSQSSQVK